jgi:SAM-dependent methyltransferase
LPVPAHARKTASQARLYSVIKVYAMDTVENVRRNIAAYYASYFNEHGATMEGAAWGSDRERLQTRWRHIVEILRLDPRGTIDQPTMLDVGCSYGGMYAYALERGVRLDYSGVDIVEAAVRTASEAHPEAAFACGDFVALYPEASFAYVVSCGTFAAKGETPHRDMHAYWKHVITNMFAKCTRGMAFNAFTNRVNSFDPDFFYVSPVEALAFCLENLSPNVVIQHASGLFDYFVYVYK